jgi:uncharacterized LabA/DUF88 family protein
MRIQDPIPPVNMPGKPQAERVVAYIDGFNLYFGIRDADLKRYLWLDLPRLAQNLLRPPQELITTKYFTSRVSGPSGKQERQSLYLDALGTISQAHLQIFYGKYMESPRTCQRCHQEDSVPSEKMTDVNIAVEMLADAYQDRFDAALLVSADSDLCAPLRKIRQLFPKKRVIVALPPERRSTELQNLASAYIVIGRGKLKDSQFAEILCGQKGHVLKKPSTWI